MARTRGTSGFSMRSGNSTSFKNMGSKIADPRAGSSAFQKPEYTPMDDAKGLEQYKPRTNQKGEYVGMYMDKHGVKYTKDGNIAGGTSKIHRQNYPDSKYNAKFKSDLKARKEADFKRKNPSNDPHIIGSMDQVQSEIKKGGRTKTKEGKPSGKRVVIDDATAKYLRSINMSKEHRERFESDMSGKKTGQSLTYFQDSPQDGKVATVHTTDQGKGPMGRAVKGGGWDDDYDKMIRTEVAKFNAPGTSKRKDGSDKRGGGMKIKKVDKIPTNKDLSLPPRPIATPKATKTSPVDGVNVKNNIKIPKTDKEIRDSQIKSGKAKKSEYVPQSMRGDMDPVKVTPAMESARNRKKVVESRKLADNTGSFKGGEVKKKESGGYVPQSRRGDGETKKKKILDTPPKPTKRGQKTKSKGGFIPQSQRGKNIAKNVTDKIKDKVSEYVPQSQRG
tara:strand:- start:2748 stop:4085 length:1338 start_codon:yes stop_codon:yes gene_type:complete